MIDDRDAELEALATLWQRDRPPDLQSLRLDVRRASRRNRLALVSEVAVGIGGVAAGLWLVSGGRWIAGLAGCLFGAFGIAISLRTRGGGWERDTRSVADAVSAALAQAQRQRRAALGGLWVCAAALLFAAIVALEASHGFLATEPASAVVRMLAVAAVAVALALMAVGAMLVRADRRVAGLARLQKRLGRQQTAGSGCPARRRNRDHR